MITCLDRYIFGVLQRQKAVSAESMLSRVRGLRINCQSVTVVKKTVLLEGLWLSVPLGVCSLNYCSFTLQSLCVSV